MITSEFPELCELCGNYFPDLDAIFSHECPGIEALLRAHRPTLGCYRTVITYYRTLGPTSLRLRLIDWGLRQMGENVELLDALRQIGPHKIGRVERKLHRTGLVEPPDSRRSEPRWLAEELDAMKETP